MTIGDPSVFGVEFEITHAYERKSLRALGFFVIYVSGRQYGVRKHDASMLACSFDEIQRRLAGRDNHKAPFSAEREAGMIAYAFRSAVYADIQQPGDYFGIPAADFCDLIHSNHIVWAPDGDAAFDDGSYVLQFDIEDRVRVIGFKCGEQGQVYDAASLSEVWLDADDFYRVLEEANDTFESKWGSMPKAR